MGSLVAMGLLQEGNRIPFLAPPVFQYLCGTSAEISIEDSPTLEVKSLVQLVSVLHMTVHVPSAICTFVLWQALFYQSC